jgi:hypothetical protein
VAVLTGAAMGMYAKNFPPGIRPAANKMVSRGAKTLAKSTQARAQLGVKAGQLALKAMPATRAVGRAVKTADRISSAAGNIIGAKSATAEAGEVMQEKRKLLFFKSKTPVTLWQSNLTGALNRQDVPGTGRFTGQNVASSEGVMFKTEGKTWHRGTTVVKTGQGERTMTHLRSMNVPANHYYFNRSISDEAAVGVASGQTKPQDVPGFAGQVSATENLCPALASTKQALIKAQVYYGKEEG